MINTLDDYISRSLPQWGDFTTNPNLRKKVDDAGNLLPFLGNTVVFLLDDDTKEKLRQLQESLYQAAPDMLAEPLQMSTFHQPSTIWPTVHPSSPDCPITWATPGNGHLKFFPAGRMPRLCG